MAATAIPPPRDRPNVDAGVIEDARARQRRQRRRGSIGLFVLALLGGLAAIVALAISGSSSPRATADATAGGLPTGALATLNVAGPLAVGPNGALYITDVARDRILVRLPDGRFRVVAGNGKVGFSGDGGPAVDAELSGVSDLAFSPSGALYIADGGRVRVIGRDGVISTLAGDGRTLRRIADGTPALSAPLGSSRAAAAGRTSLSIAISPSGALYLSTSWQLLRMRSAGRLVSVRAVVPAGPLAGNLKGLGPIALDATGNLDVAGYNGWSIWQVAPNGVAREVGPGSGARRSGGNYSVLERGTDGAVYGEDGSTILRIAGERLVSTFSFAKFLRGEYFWLTYFAFGPHHTIYADEIPGGGGFEAHQQLVSVRNSRVNLLWQEKNTTTK